MSSPVSEDAETVQSARPSQKLVYPRPSDHRLIYKPLIRPSGTSRYEIRGQREDQSVIAWGFWGGLLVVAVVLLLLASAQSFYGMTDIIWAVGALALGLLMYRYGKRSSLREEVLCEIDTRRQTIAWPTGTSDGAELALGFDELTEIVFGMTDYPVSESHKDVRVHAFTLLVRDADDRLIPVVEATPNKGEAHTIARIMSNEIGLGISYVGKGFE
ncbi:MAG: hypothetical protein ACOC9J_00695 [Persicimonas sp.]